MKPSLDLSTDPSPWQPVPQRNREVPGFPHIICMSIVFLSWQSTAAIHCSQFNIIPHKAANSPKAATFLLSKEILDQRCHQLHPQLHITIWLLKRWCWDHTWAEVKLLLLLNRERKHHLSKSQVLNYIMVFQRSKFSDKADQRSCHKYAPFLLKNFQFKLYREQG